jgi:hypothetical protein
MRSGGEGWQPVRHSFQCIMLNGGQAVRPPDKGLIAIPIEDEEHDDEDGSNKMTF